MGTQRICALTRRGPRDLGPVYLPTPTFENPLIKSLPFRTANLPPAALEGMRKAGYSLHLDHAQPNYRFRFSCICPDAQPLPKEGVVIDLLRPRSVTHVSVTGEPLFVTFETRLVRPVSPPGDEPLQALPLVPALVAENAEALCRIASFELFYRRLDTGKWASLGRHPGPASPALERIVAVLPAATGAAGPGGVRTRFLRIVPRGRSGPPPPLRLAVYGADAIAARPRTVRYVLTVPPAGGAVGSLDGTAGERRGWSWYPSGRRWLGVSAGLRLTLRAGAAAVMMEGSADSDGEEGDEEGGREAADGGGGDWEGLSGSEEAVGPAGSRGGVDAHGWPGGALPGALAGGSDSDAAPALSDSDGGPSGICTRTLTLADYWPPRPHRRGRSVVLSGGGGTGGSGEWEQVDGSCVPDADSNGDSWAMIDWAMMGGGGDG